MKSTNQNIIFKPLEGSQKLFLSCPFFEVLYDGTRGNGKTLALLMDYAKGVGRGYNDAYRGVIFRREYKELADVVLKSKVFFRQLFPKARFLSSMSDLKWVFPDGEELLLRAAKDEDDYWSYHGHEYPYLGFEELTNWGTPDFYLSMHSCCRSSNINIPRRIRATCNPFGAGHHWVKERFITPAPPLRPFGEKGRERCRIKGTLLENKILLESDPFYIKTLEQITNPNKRKAWLEGSWDIISGSFFGDCWDAERHVIKPFTIPANWVRFRAHDWGSSAPFCVSWWAVSDGSKLDNGACYPAGALINYREWYGADAQDNGLKLTVEQIADGILERETDEERAMIKYSVADPAIWKVDGGKSQAERFGDKGVFFKQADNSRISGWDTMRARMLGKESPMIYIFNTCREFIRSIPVLLPDDNNIEDIDTDQNDHVADTARYACMSRPYYLNKQETSDILKPMTFNDLLNRSKRRHD